MLCGNRDEIINVKISEYSKLAQNVYKARHDSVLKSQPLGIMQDLEI